MKVQSQGAFPYALVVAFDPALPFFERIGLARPAANLGQAGDCGHYFVSQHLALNHLAILGQLVDARTAKHRPQERNPDVLLGGLGPFVAVLANGRRGEFTDQNSLSVQPIATLTEEIGSTAGGLHGDRHQGHGNRKNQKQKPGNLTPYNGFSKTLTADHRQRLSDQLQCHSLPEAASAENIEYTEWTAVARMV